MRSVWTPLLLLLSLLLGGCHLVGTAPRTEARPRPAPRSSRPTPRPPAEAEPEPSRGSRSASELPSREDAARITSNVIDTALEVIGTPYVWGGTDENGFDCSGLIQYAYEEHGVEIPRVSRDQIRAGRQVVPRLEALLPGDILGFTRDVDGAVSHVGLYVGDGLFIHSGSAGVQVSDLHDPYWREHVVAATRIVG